MANNSILTPGYQDLNEDSQSTQSPQVYLEIDNYLSEYQADEQKAKVRENLNVPSKDYVYSKQDTDIQISTKIQDSIQQYLNMEDPHGILPQVQEMITDMVKTDGSTPFKYPQSGVDPQIAQHLTTKRYVDKILENHVNSTDPHNILTQVKQILLSYSKSSDVYLKSQTYTKQEVDQKLKGYTKLDGTTPFTSAQLGVDPQVDSHLATKRYIDKALWAHLVDVDPHNFITILNQRLSAYTKKKDVYDKTQTYSRSQIDSLINKMVNTSIQLNIQDYIDSTDLQFQNIKDQNYVKSDGSVPFTEPQSGVDAVEEYQLTTLSQLQNIQSELTTSIESINNNTKWVTSGPVETTVGFIEDNNEVPQVMTFQEVCDAIFYGKSIQIQAPEYVTINTTCNIKLCIHGSTGLIQYGELYQGDTLIYSFTKDQISEGCITIESLPINSDTQFIFRVYYTNDSMHEATTIVKCSLPVFVGLLPKWKFGNTVTMEYLIQLSTEDTEGTQNRFLDYGNDLTSFTFKYKFQDAELRHPFVVIPESYPNLDTMVTKSQTFNKDAFEVIDMIPLTIEGSEQDIIFKMYIYKEALSSLDQEVTFNFSNSI